MPRSTIVRAARRGVALLTSSRLRAVVAAAVFLGCTADLADLDGPTQAAVAPDGRVYVADGYFHARVAVFAPDGAFVTAWGERGYGRGQLQTPHGLLVTPDGVVVVADRDNGRLQRFTAAGALIDVISGPQIGRPWSVARAPDGALFVADGGDQRPDAPRAGVVELAPDGRFVRRFGSFGTAPGALSEPHMIAVSAQREVFVAEIGNDRVQRFAPRGGCAPSDPACEYEVVAGWPSLGATPGLEPLSIAVDGDRVYVGHQGDPASVWVLDRATGARTAVIGAGLVERPHGLSVDAAGTLWVVDDRGDRVVHLSADGRVLGTLGAPR
ncbi:MAG: NHL repeat-containing protein [Polyangiales bacterium]